jgi:hypothetical protein
MSLKLTTLFLLPAVFMLLLAGCGRGSQLLPAATPTATSSPISKSTPTRIPTVTLLPPVGRQLEWPIDVGTSHFGALGNKLDGFSGAWIRPSSRKIYLGVNGTQ